MLSRSCQILFTNFSFYGKHLTRWFFFYKYVTRIIFRDRPFSILGGEGCQHAKVCFFSRNTKIGFLLICVSAVYYIWTWKIGNFSSNLTSSTVISYWTLPRANICFLHYFSLGQLFCMWSRQTPPPFFFIHCNILFFVLQNTKEIYTWKIGYLSLQKEATNLAFVSVNL